MKKLLAALAAVLSLVLMTGCSTDAQVVSRNISLDADSFRTMRRIVFINIRTDEYLFVMEGNCSIEVDTGKSKLDVTCKVGADQYQKHFLYLTEWVTFTVEQLNYNEADPYHYSVVFKPEVIIPTIVR